MKKFLSSLLILFSVTVQAQHLKFMDVSLDCTIDEFQLKLAAKDFAIDADLNAAALYGTRLFEGSLFGYKSKIIAYYNTQSNIVYKVKVCIPENPKFNVVQIYNDVKAQLDKDYSEYELTEPIINAGSAVSYLIKDQSPVGTGFISLYTINTTKAEKTSFYVMVEYLDNINQLDNIDLSSGN